MWDRFGYRAVSLNDNMHVAFRTLPAYLAHLQPLVSGAATTDRAA